MTEFVKKYSYPECTVQEGLITVGGKVVNYSMLYAMIAKQFHKCLNKEAKD